MWPPRQGATSEPTRRSQSAWALRLQNLHLAVLNALKIVQFRSVAEGGCVGLPSIARTPLHAREARASNRCRELRGNYAEGLGGYPTGFLKALKLEQSGLV